MDIFRSDKAPYVLGLLVTVIGWHVSQLVNEITKTQAVSYSVRVDRRTNEVSALVRNVSRTKSLPNATFALACAGGVNCLAPLYPVAPGRRPIYGRLEPIPPNALSQQEPPEASRRSVAFTNTVAAGGRYRIIAKLADPETKINFFFIPSSEASQPLDIYIYRRDSLRGLVVENYVEILGVSLVLCVIAMLYSLVRGPSLAPAQEEGKDGN